MVLIVEDDDGIRESLKLALELEGFSVAVAENGEQGISYLKSCDRLPCVILLDLMMPVMNGWEFIERQRAEPKFQEIPVVVVSALAEKNRHLGAQGYIRKPVEIEELLATVGQYCS